MPGYVNSEGLSTGQVIVRIASAIALAEFFIMLVLGYIPHEANTYTDAVIDTTSLVALSTPLIYFWVIRPFVIAREHALDKAHQLAHTDALTALPNRRLITSQLEQLVSDSLRHHEHGAVLLIDLDGFKSVNDTYGHDAGDAVLIEVAGRLRAALRTEDDIGRLGGDEFVALIYRLGTGTQVARDAAQQIADKLIEKIKEPISFHDKTLHVGASIGIRIVGSDLRDAKTALVDADLAMFRAKDAGKGRAAIYEI